MDFEKEILEEEVNEGFIIDDDSKAEWALSKISHSKKESDRYIQTCQDMIEKYKAKIEESKQNYENKNRYLKTQLQGYFNSLHDEFKKQTKTQVSYKLPSGTLKFKKPSLKVEKDNNKLLQWLKDNDYNDFIKIEETPKWGEFKKQVNINEDGVKTKDNKQVDGINIFESESEFIVDIA